MRDKKRERMWPNGVLHQKSPGYASFMQFSFIISVFPQPMLHQPNPILWNENCEKRMGWLPLCEWLLKGRRLFYISIFSFLWNHFYFVFITVPWTITAEILIGNRRIGMWGRKEKPTPAYQRIIRHVHSWIFNHHWKCKQESSHCNIQNDAVSRILFLLKRSI